MLNAYCNNILLLLYIHVTTVIVHGLRLQQLESLLQNSTLSITHNKYAQYYNTVVYKVLQYCVYLLYIGENPVVVISTRAQ